MRIILIGVMLLAATSASADWVKVTETTDTAYYVDPASISNQPGFRRVSVIHDYAKQEPGGTRSRRVSYDIDCAGERLRSVAATEYSEAMAQGKTVNSWEDESEWLYVAPRTGSNIPPRTPYRSILRFVCAR
ncbi:MAG: surface-adhesin E family protein [Casimicrobiaceae bacterium]